MSFVPLVDKEPAIKSAIKCELQRCRYGIHEHPGCCQRTIQFYLFLLFSLAGCSNNSTRKSQTLFWFNGRFDVKEANIGKKEIFHGSFSYQDIL